MKNLLIGTILLTLIFIVPIPMMAAVDISIGISLPPPIEFSAPPELIVIPETYVYVAPEIDVDLFFWGGWWWRLWEGRWYRSHYYNRGWGYYNTVPSFYFDVDPGWRGYYREHNWYGHRWDYDRIPYQRLQNNWKSWQNNKYWEKKRTWGVQSFQRRPQQQIQELRHQREEQYHQRPEVQQHQQWRQEQQKQQKQTQPQVRKPQVQQQKVQQPRQQSQEKVQQPQRQEQKPQVQQPRQQPQEKVQQPQRQEQKPQVQQPKQQPQERVRQPQKQEQRPQGQQPQHSQPQGKPEGGEGEHKK